MISVMRVFFFLLFFTKVVRPSPADLDQNYQATSEPADEVSNEASGSSNGAPDPLIVASSPTNLIPDGVSVATDALDVESGPPGVYVSSCPDDSSTTDSGNANFQTRSVGPSKVTDDLALGLPADNVEGRRSSAENSKGEKKEVCPVTGSSSQGSSDQKPAAMNGVVVSHRGKPKCPRGWTPSCCYDGIFQTILLANGMIQFNYGSCTLRKSCLLDPLLSTVATNFPSF